MRRAPLLAVAVAVTVATPLLLLIASSRNRTGEPEAEVRLTERELRLVPVGEGKRWAVLRLDWNRHLERDRKEAGWLDGAKLASLGFDTRLPADDEEAVGFYSWQPPRKAFLALEYDGDAAARADAGDPAGRATRSRLHAVDADLDATALRGRHPDRARVLVVRGVVSAECRGHWDAATRTLSAPFLRGRIDRLLVEEIHLPRGERVLLDALASGEEPSRQPGAASHAAPSAALRADAPRFTALVHVGRRFEPWVTEVRPAGPPSATP